MLIAMNIVAAACNAASAALYWSMGETVPATLFAIASAGFLAAAVFEGLR